MGSTSPGPVDAFDPEPPVSVVAPATPTTPVTPVTKCAVIGCTYPYSNHHHHRLFGQVSFIACVCQKPPFGEENET